MTRIALGNAKAPWIIFDADNTLWAVEHLYDAARVKMCEYLSTKGIDPSAADAYQRQRDHQLYATYGYSACRFARSFEDTLLHLAADTRPEDVRHVRGLALDVFEQRALLTDGLEDVLVQVSSTYQLGIITAGERWVQERRLADFHLRDRFAAVEIVESKSEDVFRSFAIRRDIDPTNSWVIGDSYRSDIVPAKAAGFRAILLESPNWTPVEKAPGSVRPDAVIKAFRDLPSVIGLSPSPD